MITLASDFGSPYPAAMKGVVLRRSDARLVDVSHDLPRGGIRESAFWLREVWPTFPPATHLAVVDPGVGTDRDVLVGTAAGHAFVGPDNGLLCPAARRVAGDDGAIDWFHADPGDPASTTFHGRDVFAPLAAAVHDAVEAGDPDTLDALDRLTPADPSVDLRLPEARVDGDRATGEVLAVDDFGNVVTNVPGTVLDGRGTVRVDGDRVPVGETFAAVRPGEALVTVGSHGYVECDVNDGRGDERFGLDVGDAVCLGLDIE
ncbi:SAM hydrolase/SAM-dependent halogenase family protein [Haloplanus salilacus]|uniref:SAM hydrolase/SAM-dependent halogenase family protein n=1 Tax=Haloplanus salilacus TaxID=2949994 RepID=UPI0030CAF890